MGRPAQNGKTRNSRVYDFFSRLLVLPFRAGHPFIYTTMIMTLKNSQDLYHTLR